MVTPRILVLVTEVLHSSGHSQHSLAPWHGVSEKCDLIRIMSIMVTNRFFFEGVFAGPKNLFGESEKLNQLFRGKFQPSERLVLRNVLE